MDKKRAIDDRCKNNYNDSEKNTNEVGKLNLYNEKL